MSQACAVCAVHVHALHTDATFPLYFCCGPEQVPQCSDFWSSVENVTLHGSLDRGRKSLRRRVADRGKKMQCSCLVIKALLSLKLSNVVSL